MSEVEERNPLENMIDFASNAEFNKANDVFDDVLRQKVSDALEQEKVALSQEMWGNASAEQEAMEVDLDITDEDLDAAAEEYVEEDED
jgi:hypothetical protein